MKLIDILKLIERDFYPQVIEKRKHRKEIDSRPNSVYKVCICFMCEEETWVKCNIENLILVPWYDAEVVAISPQDDNTMEIWLKDVEYLEQNYSKHFMTREQEQS